MSTLCARLQALAMRTADEVGAAVVLANDPDADRLAIAEHAPRFVAHHAVHSARLIHTRTHAHTHTHNCTHMKFTHMAAECTGRGCGPHRADSRKSRRRAAAAAPL